MIVDRPSVRVLIDAEDPFEALVFAQARPRAVVLFAVGAGGDPEWHLPLLRSIAARGCTVASPRFERLASAAPRADALASRARRLKLTFDAVAEPGVPAAGAGHSIGATVLLMLAGAVATTRAGEIVRVPPERRLARLALMAPATDFFQLPGALDGVEASIVAWTGTNDEITPPATAHRLKAVLSGIAAVDVRVVAGAGHFSFMHNPPPHATEPLAHRDIVLDCLAEDVARFITE